MRAFLGLEVPEFSRHALLSIRESLDADRSSYPRLRWTSLEQMHLTVRFLGNVEPSIGDALLSRLRTSLRSFSPLSIRIEGISWFPSRRPSVLAATVAPSERLIDLFDVVEKDVVAVGLPPESRAPNPHITIARIKQNVKGRIQSIDTKLKTAFECDELVLYESRLYPTGASYSHYGVIPLGGVPETVRS